MTHQCASFSKNTELQGAFHAIVSVFSGGYEFLSAYRGNVEAQLNFNTHLLDFQSEVR